MSVTLSSVPDFMIFLGLPFLYLLSVLGALYLIGYWGLKDRAGPQEMGAQGCAIFWPIALLFWGFYNGYLASKNYIDWAERRGERARARKTDRAKEEIAQLRFENGIMREALEEVNAIPEVIRLESQIRNG